MGLIDSRAHSGLEGKEGRLSMGRCPGVAPGFIVRHFSGADKIARKLESHDQGTRDSEKSRRDTLEAAGTHWKPPGTLEPA